MYKRLVSLFSQTGSEILEVSKKLGRFPDVIITNNSIDKINTELLDHTEFSTNNSVLRLVPLNPSIDDYLDLFDKDDLITLHGWLKIVPKSICEQYTIYNGHPGLITIYPFLKGKDPQKKAFDLKLNASGCVIHKVSPEVDAGEILKTRVVDIKDLDLNTTISTLHKASVELWCEFLKDKL
jgi:folate-dependent phosphoribosylglycinamide formyltransferase PurN